MRQNHVPCESAFWMASSSELNTELSSWRKSRNTTAIKQSSRPFVQRMIGRYMKNEKVNIFLSWKGYCSNSKGIWQLGLASNSYLSSSKCEQFEDRLVFQCRGWPQTKQRVRWEKGRFLWRWRCWRLRGRWFKKQRCRKFFQWWPASWKWRQLAWKRLDPKKKPNSCTFI